MSVTQDGFDRAIGPVAAEPPSALPIVSAGATIPGSRPAAGLALEFLEGCFAIQVSHQDGTCGIALGPYEEDQVIAIWRRMAARSGLPLLLAGPDGILRPPYPQLGRVLLGDKTDRRRLAVLSGRRPRFLARRKPSRLPRRPLVHRETEIIEGRSR